MSTEAAIYRERLTVPIRWWVQATMFLATVWIAFIVATPARIAWAVTGVCVVVLILMFASIGSTEIAVRDGTLRVGKAQIDIGFLGNPEVLNCEQTRRAAGVDSDARAFLTLRPYLKQTVRIPINDPRDPTPYWLVASRHPGQLAAVLSRGHVPTTRSER